MRCRWARARWRPSWAWTRSKVIEGCAEAVRSFGVNTNEVVEAVNFNDPAQTVIAGSKAAVEKACELLKAGGAKRALPLPVSAPVPFEPDEARG